jgi:hypothetical protein
MNNLEESNYFDKITRHNDHESIQVNNKNSNNLKIIILKLNTSYVNFLDAFFFKCFQFILSIILRTLCVSVLVYVTLILINETDSYLPLFNLLFCIGIIFDLIYFINRKKEHVG